VKQLNDYECIFIAKGTLSDEASAKLFTQIEGEITKAGGKIENKEIWGRKAIAYAIKKNKDGIYLKLDFKLEPGKISELNKTYRLNEDILRAMIIKK